MLRIIEKRKLFLLIGFLLVFLLLTTLFVRQLLIDWLRGNTSEFNNFSVTGYLSKNRGNVDNSKSASNDASIVEPAEDYVSYLISEIISETDFIKGVVEKKEGKNMVIKSEIIDLDELRKKDFSQSKIDVDFTYKPKSFLVFIKEYTKFSGKGFDQIGVGDTIEVLTLEKSRIYFNDDFIADEIRAN